MDWGKGMTGTVDTLEVSSDRVAKILHLVSDGYADCDNCPLWNARKCETGSAMFRFCRDKKTCFNNLLNYLTGGQV